ncbi:MAG: ABC transporter permease, partial [Holophagales bacterium]|nr:ABC transporter permease [Holophagales bacterium]
FMTDFSLPLRFAFRSLVRSRRFTLLAVATLALGIGFTTAFFSVFDTILLRPLAYSDSEQLVTVLRPGRGPTSPANFLDLRERTTTLEHLTAATPWHPVLRGEGPPEQLGGLRASRDLFELLEAQPLLGRTFGTDEDGEDPEAILVLGHELWQNRFGGDPEILGRTLELDGESHTVVGVMPPGFHFPPFWATEARFWVPFRDPEMWSRRGANFLRVFGRLSNQATIEQAQADADRITAGLAEEHPDLNAELSYGVEPLSEPVVEGIRPGLRTILAGVGLVLLIACVNVASLWITRTAERRQELAVRLALGARSWALLRQGLAESTCVVAAAAGLGWLLAYWGLEALRFLAPPDVPRLDEVALDARVFAFTLGIAAVLAVAFALLLPAPRRLSAALAGGSRRLGGREESRGRSWMVTAEVAMALVLLLASLLMGKSLLHLWNLDPGLRTEGVLTAHLPFGGSEVAPPERQNPFFDRLLERVRGLPGVEQAALVNHLHLGGDRWGNVYEAEGQPVESPATAPAANQRVVSEDLFATFEIPLLEGRHFRPTDTADSRPVVIVSRSLAERHWPGQPVAGKRLRHLSEDDPWLEIVGVVEDVRQWSLTDEPPPTIYYPYRQNPVDWYTQTSLVVTTEGDEAALLRTVSQSLRSMSPQLPLSQPRTLRQIYGQLLWQPRFSVSLLGLFALTAVLLAAIGVYGAMANAAAARRRELGVRLALGADRADLVRLLVSRGSRSTLLGLALGLVGAALLGGLLESQLHGVSPHDPLAFAATALGIGTVALVAAYLPALRASRLDPVISLRQD